MFDENAYRKVFANVKASERIRLEVFSMKNKKKRNYFGRASRLVLVGAVLISMLTLTAFAYSGLVLYDDPKDMLEAFFGKNSFEHVESETIVVDRGELGVSTWTTPEKEREELNEELAETLIQPHVYAIGKMISFGDTNMTIDAFSYAPETRTGLIYYSVENQNGVSGYSLQPDGEIWWPGGELIYCNQGARNYIVQEQTTSNKLVVACYFYRFREDENLYLNFYEQLDWDANGNRIEGSTGINIPLNEETEGMRSISLADGNIVISPIGIVIYGKDLNLMNAADETKVEKLCIRYADGTDYLVKDHNCANYAYGTMVQKPDGYVTYCLNRIVDIDNVTAVLVDEIEYTVD